MTGLTFAFTGVFETLGRKDVQALSKRHGGRVEVVRSNAASFIVLGKEAGKRKVSIIQELGIETFDKMACSSS